eukprot:m.160074 g.160074  ORF g.160074 m.160074 type:complete len:127 (+) comp14544_c0_seq8:62-442(+)
MVFYFLSGLCFKMKSIVALLTIVSSVSEAARVSDPYRSAYFATGVVRPQTPSMGWRSWNFFACDIDQVSMKSQVDGITKAQQSSPSLLDLGYNHVGLGMAHCFYVATWKQDGSSCPSRRLLAIMQW